MKKFKVFTIVCFLTVLLSMGLSYAQETYCENVNRTGHVVNSSALSAKINQLLRLRGVNYSTSPTEISNTIKSYCRDNPYAESEDVTNHLKNITDAITGLKDSINQ